MKIAIIAKARNGPLVAYRQRFSLSQPKAAKLAGVCLMSWSRTECMRFNEVYDGVVEKIANLLGVHPYVIAPPELRGRRIQWEETAFVDMDVKQLEAATSKMLLPTEVQVDAIELHKLIEQQMGRLDDREKKILALRYGLNDHKPRTLRDVAKAVHLTKERVRQIILNAQRKMGESDRLKQLVDLDD